MTNKNNQPKINKKIAEIKSYFNIDEPVYSNLWFVERTCLFFSKWSYKLTKGLFFKTKFALQRLLRGYDDLDKWNAAWYISRKSIPVLKEMRNEFKSTSLRWHREDRHGNIIELSRDEVFSEEPPLSLSEEEWRNILDDIIFALQFVLNEDSEEVFTEENYNKNFKRHKKGMKLLSIYFMNLWD